MTNRALITGITGQDGSYLAEFLLGKGYEVHGIIRRSSSFNTGRLDSILEDSHFDKRRLFLHYGDLSDSSNIASLVRCIKPSEIYNLGAQSHVKVSFDMPEYTTDIGALGVIRLLEALREVDFECKLYQASSSEMFGDSPPPQNEKTPFRPKSPYAVAKLCSYWQVVNYRQAYNMFACNGILFNHESPRRGPTFVTKKVTRAIANIVKGTQKKLYMGNINAQRDWGYAPEFCEAMWLMLQHDKPDDYVIATNQSHTVKEFLEEGFGLVGLDWNDYVEIDSAYFRPNEVNALCGDYSKAKRILGWEPKTSFRELVRCMVKSDLEDVGLNSLEIMKDVL